ncbi:MAG: ATP-dependent DNA helicase PcrA [Deltaproteobacteria bacterium CG11_big_fil_rev_8_21_14_0_20_45_16]|nr:MAG: ATP-dependent DNA helicase PcrA [Deltaproteobacteria bacterium CG11_big_fil_rev_8_21_14_0_20_45_16]
MSFLEEIQSGLNPAQKEAVSHGKGPLLILAGAGSGKTRVLTCRIAYLVRDCGVSLNQILAMTFSNKAAREMHDRVKSLLGDDSPSRYPWISTFHSVCVRLLRRYGERAGIAPDFVIYDSDDQIALVRKAMDQLDIEDKSSAAKSIHSRISHWKNEGREPSAVQNTLSAPIDGVARKIYQEYQNLLKQAHALDFDDLLFECLKLLKADAELREQLQAQWKYILVDEFQDTNKIQYQLLEQIINPDKNICVVGDDDQSIYGWRGAKIENILNFDKQHEGCRVIKLEQNYRSTANILKAAAAVISKNEWRHEKTIWTEKPQGKKIRLAVLPDDKQEARFVIGEIKKQIAQKVPAEEIAVLYRVNSVSRVFEEECLRQRLPYKIIGGFRFYERKEIKDILAYLKLLLNPADIIAFRRCVNTPTRGVGKTSQEKIEDLALSLSKPIGLYLSEVDEFPIVGKAKRGLQSFKEFLLWGRAALEMEISFVDLVCEILERSGYLKDLQQDGSEEARDREENLKELLTAIQEFEESWEPNETLKSHELRVKIFDFLERVALIADTDQLDQSLKDQVTFMSLHAAKGLEFHTCFIAAMEDGIFPSARSFDAPDGLEEERRLCYVGITRAKEDLILTRAESRRTFGSINFQIPSRFWKDLPAELLETTVEETQSSWQWSSRRVAASASPSSYSNDSWNQDVSYDDFNQEADRFSFRSGEKVKHPSFGQGVIKKVELLGEDECLTIDFSLKGRKRVLAQFVQRGS